MQNMPSFFVNNWQLDELKASWDDNMNIFELIHKKRH